MEKHFNYNKLHFSEIYSDSWPGLARRVTKWSATKYWTVHYEGQTATAGRGRARTRARARARQLGGALWARICAGPNARQ